MIQSLKYTQYFSVKNLKVNALLSFCLFLIGQILNLRKEFR